MEKLARIGTFTRHFVVSKWLWYLVGAGFLVLTNIIAVEIPVKISEVVDQMPKDRSAPALSTTIWLIVALGLAQIIIRTLSRVFIFWPGRLIEQETKTYLFHHLLTVAYDKYISLGVGDVVSRLANDINTLRVLFAFGLLQFLNMAFVLVFSVSKMASIHESLTIYAVIPFIILIIVAKFAMPKIAYYARKTQETTGILTKKTTESFVHIHTLQLHGAVSAFGRQLDKDNHAIFEAQMGTVRARTLYFPLFQTLTLVSQGLVLWIGGLDALEGKLSVGDILAFDMYLLYIAFPISSMGILMSIWQRTKVALKRLHEMEQLPKEPLPEEPPPRQGEAAELGQQHQAPLLKVKDLSFTYSSSGFALGVADFTVKAGEIVAIYGGVGSGKSTFLSLLTKIYPPARGEITWQGRSIAAIPRDELRQQVLYVAQGSHLFSESIMQNMTFGWKEPPAEAEVIAALKAAQIYDEVMEFSDGLNTPIGEKGVRLSGGQKQRLTLARALLRPCRLLLLDDSLSALDNTTQKKVLDYLKASGKTIVVVSHRHEVLSYADRVYRIENGSGSWQQYGEDSHA